MQNIRLKVIYKISIYNGTINYRTNDEKQSICGYLDLWTSVITYNGSDLRTPPNGQHSKKVVNYNQRKITANYTYGPRRLLAPRLSPIKSPEHTH